MDASLAALIQHAGRGHIDGLTEGICAIEFLVVLWLAVFAIVGWRDRPRRAQVFAAASIALGVHFLVNELLLKHALMAFLPPRTRPWLAHPDLIVPIGHPFEDSSFPSSHTSSTAAIAVVLGVYYPRSRLPVALFVLLMALARVHNGMHYPTDVLSGAILGVGYGALAVAIVRRVAARRSRAAMDTEPAVETPPTS